MADEAQAPPPAEEAPPAEGVEGAPADAAPAEPIKHSYTLFYFNVKALAEPLRYLFAYGGIEYEDVRVTRDEWPALKPTMPMGQMPVLEVDGKRVHQSISMARFLARTVGLNGATPWEDLQIDIVVDTINDFRLKIAVVSYEPEDDIKEKKLVTLNTEVIPFYLEKLEQTVKDNEGHFALGKLTWADVYFAGIIDYMNYMVKRDLLEQYPALKAVVDEVNALESIKAWIEKRPVTEV
ncbi:glutathione S-transferase S1 [Anastrepha obliqua]|uniref:glutathione S-transferase S1 n=1 Tax=Anastrepha obliqua TaxID=95512 RepID=UPI00240A12D2|nr:glutathione S-transferase S1 [Anastrepha obliqua]XP_054740401.1 glutathione S-transferase S1 [Anastrepha obliqua]